MKIDTSKWRAFNIVDVFDVNNTHSILKSEIEYDSGNVPYVTSSEYNNGVASYIEASDDIIECGNSILIGGKTMAISYQKTPFVSNDSHNLILGLKAKEHASDKVLLFMVCALKKSFGIKYKWSNSISKKSIQEDKIYLPVTEDNQPDWEYMELCIEKYETIAKKSIYTLNKIRKIPKVKMNTKRLGTFHLYDKSLFSIDSGTKLDKVKMDTSVEEVAFVGRSNVNNGITARVKKIDGIEPYEKGNLTLALGGAYLGSCFVQPEDFYTSQNVVVLIPNKEMDFYAKQFIASAIFVESQNNYQAFIKELNAHIKRDFKIKLPIDKTGEPDWEYMIEYMKAIEKRAKSIVKLK